MPRDLGDEFPKNWSLRIGGAACGIYHGEDDSGFGIAESNGEQGRRAIVYFQCFWPDRLDLVAGLVGTVDYTGGTIVRTPPLAYPLAARDGQNGKIFPKRLFCTAIQSIVGTKSWTDDGSTTGQAFWPAYVYAVVAAEFTSPPYLIDDLLGTGIVPNDPSFNDLTYQQYIISRTDVAGEVFAPPTGAFKFAGGAFAGNPLLDVGAAHIRTRFEVSITRVRMPLVPMITITSLTGTVNNAPFLVGGQMFPKGAMLFMGASPNQRTDPYNGGIIWDVEYKFMANGQASGQTQPLDWNYFLDPGGVWSQVQTAGGADVFAYADHSVLYQNAIS